MPTKEQVHDDKISPLMRQIIAVCKEHGIAMFATFHLPDETQDTLRCTTHLPDGDGKFDPVHSNLHGIIYPSLSRTMITTRNAIGDVTNVTAIL